MYAVQQRISFLAPVNAKCPKRTEQQKMTAQFDAVSDQQADARPLVVWCLRLLHDERAGKVAPAVGCAAVSVISRAERSRDLFGSQDECAGQGTVCVPRHVGRDGRQGYREADRLGVDQPEAHESAPSVGSGEVGQQRCRHGAKDVGRSRRQ